MFMDKIMKNFKRNVTHLDIGFLKASCVLFGIWLAIIFPQLTTYDHWWVLGFAIILGLKPALAAFKK